MNTTPDHLLKQKLAIAKLLPERIIIYSGGIFWKPEDFHTSNELPKNEILDTEWLQIVHDCIRKQPIEIQWLVFAKLDDIVDSEIPAYLGTVEEYFTALEAAGIINTKE